MQQPVIEAPQPPREPRRRFSFRRLFRRIILVILILALGFLLYRYGPNLYMRIFGGGNVSWISERFGEEVRAKNEMIVFETTITGQESVSQDAWLIGEVQKVVVPYSFTMSYVVNMEVADVSSESTLAGEVVTVRIPSPKPEYYKLTVDEANMKKHDFLYPLTPERYAEIKTQIENKLYAECAARDDYANSAWEYAVKNLEGLFRNFQSQNQDAGGARIVVKRDDTLTAPTATPE